MHAVLVGIAGAIMLLPGLCALILVGLDPHEMTVDANVGPVDADYLAIGAPHRADLVGVSAAPARRRQSTVKDFRPPSSSRATCRPHRATAVRRKVMKHRRW